MRHEYPTERHIDYIYGTIQSNMKKNSPSIVYYPLGDSAIVIELGEEISATIQEHIYSISTILYKNPLKGMVELVPAFTNLTVFYDPLVTNYTTAEQALRQLLHFPIQETFSATPIVIEIPVWYGNDAGPDLPAVATHAGISTEEVIALHTANNYLVYMIGFAPGFPYLGGLNEKLACPRKAIPRSTIPAGSVGIAGVQTGIYPIETPGGWQIIGQTPLRLFDVNKNPPALIQAGNHLRFVAITEQEFIAMKKEENGN